MASNATLNKEYLPIEGYADFLKHTAVLILGEDSSAIKENRVSFLKGILKFDPQNNATAGCYRSNFEWHGCALRRRKVFEHAVSWANSLCVRSILG